MSEAEIIAEVGDCAEEQYAEEKRRQGIFRLSQEAKWAAIDKEEETKRAKRAKHAQQQADSKAKKLEKQVASSGSSHR